jgi:Holliday junction resolvase RusA-like endonuclease
MSMEIIIPGIPVSKKRPRFFVRGKHVGAYNPQESEESKTMWHIAKAMNGQKPCANAVALDMTFYMPIPASLSQKKREALLIIPLHTKKPDIDNLIKHVLDSANGILFEDDRQICEITARKRYGAEAKTIVKVST